MGICSCTIRHDSQCESRSGKKCRLRMCGPGRDSLGPEFSTRPMRGTEPGQPLSSGLRGSGREQGAYGLSSGVGGPDRSWFSEVGT